MRGSWENLRQLCVSSLHNGWEFSQLPKCFDEATLVNMEKVLYCFHKIFLKNKSTNEGKCCFLNFLIGTDFLDPLLMFPTSQSKRTPNNTTNENSSDVTAIFTYSHLNTAIDQWECLYYPNYFIKLIVLLVPRWMTLIEQASMKPWNNRASLFPKQALLPPCRSVQS